MAKEPEDKLSVCAATWLAIGCLAVGSIVGALTGRVAARSEIVEKNAAEYRLNSRTGEVEFCWKWNDPRQTYVVERGDVVWFGAEAPTSGTWRISGNRFVEVTSAATETEGK